MTDFEENTPPDELAEIKINQNCLIIYTKSGNRVALSRQACDLICKNSIPLKAYINFAGCEGCKKA